MMMTAIVSTIEGTKYRVTAGGVVSMPVPALKHVEELHTGDTVLCWFYGATLAEGVIIGIGVD